MLSVPFDTFKNTLFPYRDALTYLGIAVSVVAFAVSFIIPAVGKRRAREIAARSATPDATLAVEVEPAVRPGAG
jgi:hypothetical protein